MRPGRRLLSIVLLALGACGLLAVSNAEGGPPWARLDGNNFFTGANDFFNSDDFGFSVTSDGSGASILATANGTGNAVMGFANAFEGGAAISGRGTGENTVGVSAVTEVGNLTGTALSASFEDPSGDGAAVYVASHSPHAKAGWFNVWADNADQLFSVSQSNGIPGNPGVTEVGAFVVGNHGSVEISGDVELTGLGPSQNGDLTAAGSMYAQSFVPSSSARFKDNIAPLTDAIGTVEQLRGVSFEWVADGRHDIGVVAEEVAEVLPELVRHDDAGRARGVDYSKLTAVLIEAMKEQQEQIRELERRIADLKNQE